MDDSRRKFMGTLGAGATFMALSSVGCASSSGSAAVPTSDVAPLWKAGGTRNKIVVISDLHLGVDDDFTETLVNRPLLVKFLQSLQNTQDVRELVIAGDFLDEWYLPVFYYPLTTDHDIFYRRVIANNQTVIDQLNRVIASGIKVVYVPGNHDLTLKASVLQAACPGLVQASGAQSGIPDDPQGLGAYYTGDRREIVIEHGHRYDPFSAPDTITNEALCGNKGNTILPSGYFYSRYAATWVIEDRPVVPQHLPEITDRDYAAMGPSPYGDQASAYTYYNILTGISNRMTPYESGDAHFATDAIFRIRMCGFNGDYTYKDFFPQMLTDNATGQKYISSPTLFRNVHLTWQARQIANKVKVPEAPFGYSALGAVAPAFPDSFYRWAKANYLTNPSEANVEVVVFGHTHVPSHRQTSDGKRYVNAGTWIDHNTDLPKVGSRTFVVVTTGAAAGKDATAVLQYGEKGDVADITATVS